MLNTQPPASETQTPPPTPQEIAQAIAAIEEHKHSPASSQAVQTTVSEVIDHLGLDMTAEDILAEVQAQRALPKPLASLPMSLRKRVAGITAVVTVLFFGTYWIASQPAPRPAPDQAVSAPPFMNYTPSPQHLAITPDTLVKDATGHTPTLKTLAEIPDNHPVLCGVTWDGQPATDHMDWTLIKYDGQVYLRCFTVPMSARALAQAVASRQLFLFPRHGGFVNNAKATAPLTIPASSLTLTWQDGDHSDESLQPITLRLDSHAHEPWKP